MWETKSTARRKKQPRRDKTDTQKLDMHTDSHPNTGRDTEASLGEKELSSELSSHRRHELGDPSMMKCPAAALAMAAPSCTRIHGKKSTAAYSQVIWGLK